MFPSITHKKVKKPNLFEMHGKKIIPVQKSLDWKDNLAEKRPKVVTKRSFMEVVSLSDIITDSAEASVPAPPLKLS